jgi:hypothetical protein
MNRNIAKNRKKKERTENPMPTSIPDKISRNSISTVFTCSFQDAILEYGFISIFSVVDSIFNKPSITWAVKN